MKYNNLKAVICLLLCAVFCMQIISIAFAGGSDDTAPEQIRYVNIDDCSCRCYISGLTLYANATLKAKSSMNLNITCELQKLKSGEYETIKTWTASNTSTILTWSDSRLINLLATYRIKVTFTAGSESTTLYAYA